jgi:hypothetical protein
MNVIFRSKLVYLFIFIFSILIFLVHYYVSQQAVYGDGIGYYAHLRSWVIDGDWNYTNEYKHLYNHQNNNALEPAFADQVQIVSTTSDGRAENQYSPGVAILLLPFYVVAHFFSLTLHFLGVEVSMTGYSDLYQIMTGIGAITYVVFGLWLLEQVLKKILLNDEMALLTTLTIFFATQLLYYGSFDVINSHFASFFLISSFFYISIIKKATTKNIFLLGLFAGLLTVNRLQDGIIAILWILFQFNQQNFESLKLFFIKIGTFCLGCILSLWPLLYHWQNTFSSIFEQTYFRNLERDLGTHGVDLLGSFFHPVTGLFIKAPVLLLALIYGVYISRRKIHSYLFLPGAFFIIQSIIITIQGGWYAAAYGGRMYISSLVFFAFLLGLLFKDLKNRNTYIPYITAGIFVFINFFSIVHFVIIQK